MPSSLRFLRIIGCKPIPHYYRTTVSRFAYEPLIFGGLWGLGMFLVLDVPDCLIPTLVLGAATLGYALTGLSEITILQQRRRQNLSKWEDL